MFKKSTMAVFALMLLIFSGCAFVPVDSSPTPTVTPISAGKFDNGAYVAIKDARIDIYKSTTSKDEKAYLIVSYDFSHSNDFERYMFSDLVFTKAMQNGESCEPEFSLDKSDLGIVRAYITTKEDEAFALNDLENSVEITIQADPFSATPKFSKTFNLTELEQTIIEVEY